MSDVLELDESQRDDSVLFKVFGLEIQYLRFRDGIGILKTEVPSVGKQLDRLGCLSCYALINILFFSFPYVHVFDLPIFLGLMTKEWILTAVGFV